MDGSPWIISSFRSIILKFCPRSEVKPYIFRIIQSQMPTGEPHLASQAHVKLKAPKS
jgi:hypothetical protein